MTMAGCLWNSDTFDDFTNNGRVTPCPGVKYIQMGDFGCFKDGVRSCSENSKTACDEKGDLMDCENSTGEEHDSACQECKKYKSITFGSEICPGNYSACNPVGTVFVCQSLNCIAPQVACEGACVDFSTTNMSSCGVCKDGFANCDGSITNGCEVNINSNREHCSGCGLACEPGMICSGGVCETSCLGTQVYCGDKCINPGNDPAYCGASGDCLGENAGVTCPTGKVCVSGVCAASCLAGQELCDNFCVVLATTNMSECGVCVEGFADCDGRIDNGCEVNLIANNMMACETCAPGFANCDGRWDNGCEVNLNSDRMHCGACGERCPTGQVCAAGECLASCLVGQVYCDSQCVTPSTSNQNCGATGTDNSCTNAGTNCTATGRTCSGGSCVCQPDWIFNPSQSRCLDPSSNATCGATASSVGTNCTTTSRICSGGSCICQPGWVFNTSQSKCLDPSSNATCGATASSGGTLCPSGQICNGSTCAASCLSGQVYCDSRCVTPSTDSTNCGATGTATTCTNAGTNCNFSTSGRTCVNGLCVCQSGLVYNTSQTKCLDPSNNTTCGASASSGGTDCTATSRTCSGSGSSWSCACPSGLVYNTSQTKCLDPSSNATCGATASNGGTSCNFSTTGRTCVQSGSSWSCTCQSGWIYNSGQGKCLDPSNNATCGATSSNAGSVCSSGQICNGSTCAASCLSSQVYCDNRCVTSSTDNANCGATGTATSCTSVGANCNFSTTGRTCVGGLCVCQSGLVYNTSQTKCLDPSNNTTCGASASSVGTNCTTTGRTCSGSGSSWSCACPVADWVYNSGQLKCLDPSNNATCGASASSVGTNCTTTGRTCSGSGSSWSCACPVASWVYNTAQTKCLDPNSNASCGATSSSAGTTCSAGQICNGTSCATSCLGTQVLCDGKCIDPQADNAFCGASLGGSCNSTSSSNANYQGVNCNFGTTGQSCLGGTCRCPDNSTPNLSNDLSHCGRCGNNCTALAGWSTGSCSSGSCSASGCTAGFCRSGSTCVFGFENNSACGIGGNCVNCTSSGKICQSGGCVCPSDKPYESAGNCVKCLNDGHCSATELCDTSSGECVAKCTTASNTSSCKAGWSSSNTNGVSCNTTSGLCSCGASAPLTECGVGKRCTRSTSTPYSYSCEP